MKKTCTKCKRVQPLSNFYLRPNYNKTKTVLHKSHCKDCEINRVSNWRQKNLKHCQEYAKKYYSK